MNKSTRANAGLDTLGTAASDETLLNRIRGEYLEMPGLRLTRPQAQRLWGLDTDTSVRVLHELVELKFLMCAADGAYVRLSDGHFPMRMARADIDPAGLSRRTAAHRR
jgi:Fic family protein